MWGLGAAGSRVVAFAIIRDTRQGEQMARTMSYVMGVFVLVPIIAPSIGAIVVAIAPWRTVFWLGAVAAGALLLWSRRLTETLAVANRRPMRFGTVRTTAARMVTNPVTLASVLASAALMAVMASYLGSSQLIIAEIFGRPAQFPVIFGAIALLLGLASFFNSRLLRTLGLRRTLPLAAGVYAGSATLALIVALLGDGRPAFWLYMPLLGITLGCQMVLMPNLNTVALAPMADAAGTASALVATFASGFGALIAAGVDAQMQSSVTPFAVAVAVAGFFLLGMVAWIGRKLSPEGSGF